eukprot:1198436-Alexandrium_andersonii.AAC.1
MLSTFGGSYKSDDTVKQVGRGQCPCFANDGKDETDTMFNELFGLCPKLQSTVPDADVGRKMAATIQDSIRMYGYLPGMNECAVPPFGIGM